MSGILEGGWEFVWAAYGATAVALVGYSLSVLSRLRRENARRRQHSRTSEVRS